ncbi:MAG: PIN domain-containing protein [Geminicoccaceae bacterium]
MPGLLLDTTVLIDVSRGFRPTVRWVERQPLARLYLCSLTVGELVRGAYRRFASSPAVLTDELHHLRTGLLQRFGARVLGFDAEAAEIWGRLMGEGEARGARPPSDDAKIAAIALLHGLTLATSNQRDLAAMCPTIDPRTA